MTLNIIHQQNTHQFIYNDNGKIATLDYSISDDGKTLNFFSTFVTPELRGQKIGQEIVKFGLEYAKKQQFKIIPTCPFVKKFVEQHPEYQQLVNWQ